MMKIGMMTDNYQTHVSGVTNHISLCKKWLENTGHQVYVFTFGQRDEVDEENNIILTRGLPITDFYASLHYHQRAKELLYTMDVVHVHHPFASGIIARRYCTPRNIPIVFTNHTRYDLYSQAYLPLLHKTIGEPGLNAYLSQFYRACDLVIIPSESLHQRLVDQFGAEIPFVVIPNGVDLDPINRNVVPTDRRRFGFTDDHIIAIYVGRLAPEKNLSFLLNTFEEVVEQNSRVRLLFVGDGPERKNLESHTRRMRLESKVYFTGIVPYNEVPSYLACADLFAIPSLSEVFPLSLIEAIGSGLPVVGIDAPGTSDIIIDGVNGLISRDDLSSFTEKLVKLSSDDGLRKKLGQQAAESAKRYDVRITTEILAQHYTRVIDVSKQRANIV